MNVLTVILATAMAAACVTAPETGFQTATHTQIQPEPDFHTQTQPAPARKTHTQTHPEPDSRTLNQTQPELAPEVRNQTRTEPVFTTFTASALGAKTATLSPPAPASATFTAGDLWIIVKSGFGWLHSFPLFMGIKIKNPPQIAVWTESSDGRYLETIYVTRRAAEGAWRGGKDRPEALPAWNFARGADARGIAPVVDGVSGATPKAGLDVKRRPEGEPRRFTVKVEINHSADWTEWWPEGAAAGSAGYSAESGQPALVYAAAVDLDSPVRTYTAELLGHSSPDGTDGAIRPDTSRLTSALAIVRTITIEIN